MGGGQRDGAGLCLVVPSAWMRGSRHRMEPHSLCDREEVCCEGVGLLFTASPNPVWRHPTELLAAQSSMRGVLQAGTNYMDGFKHVLETVYGLTRVFGTPFLQG